MPAAFAEFLGSALPMDGGRHTLALGENHTAPEHLQWLKQHLPELKATYGITTIGIETTTDLNPLFWAYQDKSLERALGGDHEKAHQYVETMTVIMAAKPAFRETEKARAQLLMDAMDKGIRVVAYDSRDLCVADLDFQDEVRKFDTYEAKQVNKTPEAFRESLRTDAAALDKLLGLDLDFRNTYFAGELLWLRSLSPNYKPRMEAVVRCWRQAIKKLRPENLPATG
ncbi:MAG: hypothetical protein K2X09_05315 [Rickettsiales bacterium]|nr:hypothetical protein [Rickettsiales bacterium]